MYFCPRYHTAPASDSKVAGPIKAAWLFSFALLLHGIAALHAEPGVDVGPVANARPTAGAAAAAAPPAAQVAPITLSAPVTPAAPPKQMEVDVPAVRAKYPNLLKIKHFSTVDVVIIGSKARLGLKDPTTELNDFATYCFGQLFKGYDIQPQPSGRQVNSAGEFGTLNLIVNTYPMGVSCELRMGTVGSENTWVTNDLRVSSSNAVKDARLLKTTIAQMMAKAAYTLRKTQGK